MKFLLVALNASYSHTNSAVRSIKEYVLSRQNIDICFGEWTINQPIGEIYKGIYEYKPDVILFSTYIWNIELVCKIIPDLKKILSDCVIGAGGPEVSYWPEGYLKKLKALDFVICGEGEKTVNDFCKVMLQNIQNKEENLTSLLAKVPGIFYKNDNAIFFSGDRDVICDLSELSFPYPQILEPDTRLYYYESNRGCPFNCSYCMSSLDRKVRFMPLERVYKDLQLFIDAKVKIVKFVDRTFNLNEEHYLNIWQYILDHQNGKTKFHFEIEAEYLSEKALQFLQQVPEGLLQFEIGVQSSNKKTLREISRSDNIEKLAENVRRIPKTIHTHLDLIAGLPYEDLDSFSKSFDFVMDLAPDALQLGFLKVLHGTKMEEYARQNGWKWMQNPPYETFSTPYMSYNDFLLLKDIETLVDAFYNSHDFDSVCNYVSRHTSWWNFFMLLWKFGKEYKVFEAARRPFYWFEFFAWILDKKNDNLKACFSDDEAPFILYDLLRYDYIKPGKKGGFPAWYRHRYDKERHRTLLEQNGGITNSRLDFAYSDYEVFDYNVLAEIPEKESGYFEVLLKYERRS